MIKSHTPFDRQLKSARVPSITYVRSSHWRFSSRGITMIIFVVTVIVIIIMMLFIFAWYPWILPTKYQAILWYVFYRWVKLSAGLPSGLLKNTQQVNDRAGNWIWLSQVLNLRSFTQYQGLDRGVQREQRGDRKELLKELAWRYWGIPREEVLQTKGKVAKSSKWLQQQMGTSQFT